MINYEMEKNEGDLNFKSKEQAILELIVVSNSVLKILDTDGVDDAELKEVYTRVCEKYSVSLDCRLFRIANDMEVDALNRLVSRADAKEGGCKR